MDKLKAIIDDAENAGQRSAALEREPANLPDGYISPLVGNADGIQWYRARRALSFYAWDIYAGAAIKHYQATHPNIKPPILNKQGAYVGYVRPSLCEPLEAEYFRCREVPWRDQRPEGYSFDPFDNAWSSPQFRDRLMSHREMSANMNNLLNEILSAHVTEIEAVLGHAWSAGAVRLYSQKPGEDGGLHTDKWPLSLRKMMIYPSGAGIEQGSTMLMMDDAQTVIMGGKGVWSIFNNSIVPHKAWAPRPGNPPRSTIEITIMPAFRSDPAIKGHGIHVGYPWLPPDIDGLEGDKVPLGFDSASIKERSLLRSLMLAVDLPHEAKTPDHLQGLGYLDV